jgi:AraC-like DNA-binding protein
MEAAAVPPPLQRFAVVDTLLPDEAQAKIGRIFCPHLLFPCERAAQGFHARHNSARQPGYSVNFVAYGAAVDIDPGALGEFFLLQIPTAGTADVTCGTSAVAAIAGRAGSILSPTLPTRMRWHAGAEKLIVLLDRAPMEQLAAALTDSHPRSIEFETGISFDTPAGAAIRQHAQLMLSIAESPMGWADAYLTRLREGLSTLLLTQLAHSESARLKGRPPAPAPRAVRRAEAFIAAHCERPIAMADVALHAGVSLRSLQEGFRRFRGIRMTDHLQTERLARFRDGLLAAAPDASVTEIAFDAGLGHLGRAAAAYRQRFGETPSQTLRRRR